MSLIKCPGCNNYISELENNCPNCSFVITEELVEWIRAEEEKEPERKLTHQRHSPRMSSWMAYR